MKSGDGYTEQLLGEGKVAADKVGHEEVVGKEVSHAEQVVVEVEE